MNEEPKVAFPMELRDYFAAKAMQGILASRQLDPYDPRVVIQAYAIADAMLEAK